MSESPTPPEIPSNRSATQPMRSRLGGIAMLVGAVVLACGAVAWAVYAYYVETSDLVLKTDFELSVLGLCGAVGAFVVGRKLLAPDAQTVLARDPRRPVVFLRPFGEDSRRVHGLPLGVRSGGRRVANDSRPASWEEKIARPLRRIGPFVSVGAPGDKLAPLGSARMYLSDDDWQAEVLDLIRRAAAIVLQPDTTAGTRWELDKVAQLVDPRRLLVIVPNPDARPLGYARIQALTAETFSRPLPTECSRVDAFVFDENGRPQPIVFGRRAGTALQSFIEQVQALPTQSRESA